MPENPRPARCARRGTRRGRTAHQRAGSVRRTSTGACLATSDNESANCQRFCVVPCGTRNDDPACRLGNVSWTPGSTGTIRLSKSLKLTLNALTARDDTTRVHVPSAECNRLRELLPLRRRADRALDGAGGDVVFALRRSNEPSRRWCNWRANPGGTWPANRRAARRRTCDGSSAPPCPGRRRACRRPGCALPAAPNPNRRCRCSGPPSVKDACCRSNGGSPTSS